ncbi:MAG: serine hydrolase domain-containing protein, partial [Bacteroidales bacterium]|nr:serine hydrolase domain-containing protein [Bacteroidales bacterium]
QYHNAMPGVAVAVTLNGKVFYNKAFGLSNLEFPIPNTSETIFECGSVSKQFTAAAILLLAQEGKLSLSDDVRKYVPELPQYDVTITIQNLLNHTSGLKDWGALYSLTGWPRTTRCYTQQLGFDIIFKQKSLNFAPGSRYSYSNSNYLMLVLITERVSGKSLAEFTTEKFFKPLGMTKTQWRDNFKEVVQGRAVAYSARDGEFYLDMPFEDIHGPGGLLTTTADLLKWNRLLETNEIFTGQIAQQRITPGLLSDGSSPGYAAGLMIGELNGYNEISHSGSTAGYRAWLAWYPDEKLSVAILSNYAAFNPTVAGRAVASVFLGTPQITATIRDGSQQIKQPAYENSDLNRYIGAYYSEEIDVTYQISLKDGELEVYRKAGDTFRLIPTAMDEFSTTANGRFIFTKDKRGRITGFTVSVSRAENVPFKIISG